MINGEWDNPKQSNNPKMTENQYNDNLEQFFKANLEKYAQAPSGDFWERMEPVIPAKPRFWSGKIATVGKWVGLGLLMAALALLLLLWRNDRAKVAKLSKTVAQQQQQIEQLGETARDAAPVGTVQSQDVKPSTAFGDASQSPTTSAPQVATGGPVITQKDKTTKAGDAAAAFSSKAKKAAQTGGGNKQSKELAEAHILENQEVAKEVTPSIAEMEATVSNENLADQSAAALDEDTRTTLPIPAFLAFRITQFSSKSKHALSFKYRVNRPQKPFPRFSIESGATAYFMPMGHLFTQDSLFTGSSRISSKVGVLLSYELNPRLAFQTGYQYKNIQAEKLVLRYNSFPFLVRRQWAWSRRVQLEAKTGLTLNSLLNASTQSDGLAVKGLKPTWLGLHGSFGITVPVGERLTFTTGPSLGFTLTRIADMRRTWEAGLGLGLRYHFW